MYISYEIVQWLGAMPRLVTKGLSSRATHYIRCIFISLVCFINIVIMCIVISVSVLLYLLVNFLLYLLFMSFLG